MSTPERQGGVRAGWLQLRGCRVDVLRRRVERGGDTLSLTPREAALLERLAARPGEIVSRDALLVEIWGFSERVISRAVDTAVRRLRTKIELDPSAPDHVFTVRGEGYRFVPLASPTPSRERPTLPEPGGRFVGRTAELAALKAAWEAGARLVTLKGVGGVGKTRLALQAARESGVAGFCELIDARSVEDLIAAVSGALDAPLQDEETAAAAVRRLGLALGARDPGLWVLDNFEQLPDGASRALEVWLTAAPEARILVTSREPLGARGERLIEIGPMEPADAQALFAARAAGGALRDEALVRTLTEQLDRLPLAIELAAARTDLLSLEEIQTSLAAPLRLLSRPGARPVDRHGSLARALAWSWERLTDWERGALSGCAVFRGGFTATAFARVVGPDCLPDAPWHADLLAALRDRSLLQVSRSAGGRPRFSLLRTVRAFARGLAGSGPALARRHADHYLAEAERRLPADGRSASSAALAWLRLERENLEAALVHSRGERPAVAVRLALALAPMLARRGPYSALRAVLDDAMGLLQDRAGSAALRARLLLLRGEAERLGGRLEDARRALDGAVASAERSGEQRLIGRCENARAWLWAEHGYGDGGGASLARALEISRANEDRHTLIAARLLQAILTPNPERQIEALEIARAAAASEGWETLEGRACSFLGVYLHPLGRTDEALARLARALEIIRAQGDRMQEGWALNRLSVLHLDQARYPRALELLAEAEQIFREVGFLPGLATVRSNQGTIHLHRMRLEQSAICLGEALAAFRDQGDRRQEGLLLVNLGVLEAERGRDAAARAALVEARALGEALEWGWIVGMAGGWSAALDLLDGRPDEAALEAAVAACCEAGDVRAAAAAGGWLGALHLLAGRLDEAESCLDAAQADATTHGDGLTLGRLGLKRAALAWRRGDRALGDRRLAQAAERLRAVQGDRADAALAAWGALADGVAPGSGPRDLESRLARALADAG